ncbi:helix-turn-helix transcriptional regulator [Mumia sp. zg.B17]|uniref:helix-turn-helix transcriptional regulator n=1 Tax=Mumia sp. zg.B17 TaxID=2855446 RepID=UPI001C6E9B12|nr:helix-turn-helix domain-containing protein [Mumia sp. zg.B17]MBW9204561.1 helix-turn-helix transcriptional regulator [Mumia sp. zg.B17]
MPDLGDPVRRSHLRTIDAELGREVLDHAYGSNLRLTGDLRHVGFSRADTRDFTLDHVDLGADISYDCDPLGYLTILEGRRGWAEYVRGGTTDQAGPGDLVMVAGPGDACTGRSSDLAVRGISLRWDLMTSATRDLRGDRPTAPMRFTRYRPADRAAVLHWRNLVDYVEDLLADGQEIVSARSLDAVGRLLSRTALIMFGSDSIAEETMRDEAQDRRDASEHAVNRAIAFMEEHADTELSVADIADAARVTPRSLQIAFRRHLGTTPMAYARRVRLDHARRDLLAGRDGDTVTAVASRWGFHNHGRFAAEYRELYGENPGDTRAR